MQELVGFMKDERRVAKTERRNKIARAVSRPVCFKALMEITSGALILFCIFITRPGVVMTVHSSTIFFLLSPNSFISLLDLLCQCFSPKNPSLFRASECRLLRKKKKKIKFSIDDFPRVHGVCMCLRACVRTNVKET